MLVTVSRAGVPEALSMADRVRDLVDRITRQEPVDLADVLAPLLVLTDHEQHFYGWCMSVQEVLEKNDCRLEQVLSTEEVDSFREAMKSWNELPALCRFALFPVLVRLAIVAINNIGEINEST
jgi:hypothetical protein